MISEVMTTCRVADQHSQRKTVIAECIHASVERADSEIKQKDKGKFILVAVAHTPVGKKAQLILSIVLG